MKQRHNGVFIGVLLPGRGLAIEVVYRAKLSEAVRLFARAEKPVCGGTGGVGGFLAAAFSNRRRRRGFESGRSGRIRMRRGMGMGEGNVGQPTHGDRKRRMSVIVEEGGRRDRQVIEKCRREGEGPFRKGENGFGGC